jgi:hypothetical protein
MFAVKTLGNGATQVDERVQTWSLIPSSSAKTFPNYVPKVILDDYNEACLIRDLSPKASATLSRRCLQGMIRDLEDSKGASRRWYHHVELSFAEKSLAGVVLGKMFHSRGLLASSVRKSRPSTQPCIATCLGANADVRQGVKQSKDIEEPENHGNHHDTVQDGLDAALHGDKAID